MLKAGHIVDNTIVIDAKSGYTGAGRRPALNKLLTEAENNFCAYALGVATATRQRSSRTSPTSPARI